MNKKIFAGLLVLLMLVIAVAGCVKEGAEGEGEIENKEEASEAISDIGTDVEDISTTLDDITESLGSAVRPK